MIKHCAAARAILSLPLDARRKALSRQQRYDAFRRRFGHVFPRPLPEAIGYCQFAYVDADWTPRLLGERGAPLPDGEASARGHCDAWRTSSRSPGARFGRA